MEADAAHSQQAQDTHGHQKLGLAKQASPSGTLEGAVPSQHPDFRFLIFKTVRE